MANTAFVDFFVQIYYTIKTDLEKLSNHIKLCKMLSWSQCHALNASCRSSLWKQL